MYHLIREILMTKYGVNVIRCLKFTLDVLRDLIMRLSDTCYIH